MERSIKELLIILRDSLAKGDKVGYGNWGICGEIYDLYCFNIITYDEKELLNSYIFNNKPKNRRRGYLGFWWQKMQVIPEYRQVRIDFVNKLIEEIKWKLH